MLAISAKIIQQFGEPGFGLGVLRSSRARRFRDVAADLLKLIESPSVQHTTYGSRAATNPSRLSQLKAACRKREFAKTG